MMIEALAMRDLHGTAIGRSQLFQKGIGQRALADAGLAGHEHDLTLARQRQAEAPFEAPPVRPPARPAATARGAGIAGGGCGSLAARRPASPAPSTDSRAGAGSRYSAGGGHRRRAPAAAPGCRRSARRR